MKESQGHIIIVDDDLTNLKIGKSALSDVYTVLTLDSAEKLFRELEEQNIVKPDLILLDLDMPGMSGFEALRKLKLDQETQEIPVIIVTGMDSDAQKLKSLDLGASDLIIKPFTQALLRKRVDIYMSTLVMSNIGRRIRISILREITEQIERRDGEMGEHISQLDSSLKLMIGAMRENERYAIIAQRWNTADILQASALHDIGMIVVPEEILLKPGKLTEEEFERMQRHVPVGLRMLERMETPSTARFFQLAKDVVAMHHERWDGSGYPKGLKGSETPLLGRLMALVDVYSALRRPRPYREAKSRDAALAEIFALQNVHFDPDLVEVCRSVADRLP